MKNNKTIFIRVNDVVDYVKENKEKTKALLRLKNANDTFIEGYMKLVNSYNELSESIKKERNVTNENTKFLVETIYKLKDKLIESRDENVELKNKLITMGDVYDKLKKINKNDFIEFKEKYQENIDFYRNELNESNKLLNSYVEEIEELKNELDKMKFIQKMNDNLKNENLELRIYLDNIQQKLLKSLEDK